jgi:hypothetical protein
MARLMGALALPADLDACLAAAQATLEADGGPLRSLDPTREAPARARRSAGARASTLAEIVDAILTPLRPSYAEALAEPLAEGLSTLALAQLDAFPGNLFWDLDLIAAMIVAEAARLELGRAQGRVRDGLARMAGLQHLYGQRTAINFSYVHDFVYGFDWAKWVAREPALHDDPPGPFSPTFLDYMDRRGHELLELIAEDDDKYPTLDGDEPRNPFPFSRAPAAEIRLHRELARRDLIPVPSWSRDPQARDWRERWRIDFAARRVEVAVELGLGF